MKMPAILVATGEMIGIDGEVFTTIKVFLELAGHRSTQSEA
jgi:hypothetical protein